MLLIHGRERAWDTSSEAERAGHYERYGKLQRGMEEHGHYVGGDEMDVAASAKLVRVRDGETVVSDGPFSDAEEQFGGYFLVNCDQETALAYASRDPGRGRRHDRGPTTRRRQLTRSERTRRQARERNPARRRALLGETGL